MDESGTSETYDAHRLLRGLELFRHLDAATLDELAAELEWFALPGGATLFEYGEPSDALCVLKSGSLGAFKPAQDGSLQLDGVVAAGETVGELGLIVDQPRSATVRALRDSELLRLSRRGFDKLVARHPQAMLVSARLAVKRLVARREGASLSAPRTFAVLAHDAGVDARDFAERLRESLARYGECALVDAEAGQGHLSAWFSALEARVRFVLYLGDGSDRDWRDLCVRQSDCILLVANADDPASVWPEKSCIDAERALHRPRHLVLLHRGGAIAPGAARRWLDAVPGVAHHHVRGDADIERVARLLTGRSIGLVLSGGGARGFAHIGVVRALREAGVQIDCVGGTSIGAIIGAGVAADWSNEEMFDNYYRAFVIGKPLSDYTLPFVALVTGRRVARLLREAFGPRDIADLALPYYCITSNLSAGRAETHRAGPLWFWLRASCAIPGVLPPVFHRGEVFVDGAVMDNLPVDAMRAQGVGEVIAVDIGADDVLHAEVEEFALPPWWKLAWQRWFHRHQRPGILSILLRSGMVNAEAASLERRARTSLLLTPPLDDIELLDWKAYQRAIEAGYNYARKLLGSANAPRELP
ncbi:MAG: patatin-like phospholipase family protein [Xanthomonadaceae bacterium]|nr:patatin-like phospholipase family protein [Xanthomonadaceae bacterium]MDE2085549.1 patatin-like phospholipase family protein [Xanthomonadaceae bacterium]